MRLITGYKHRVFNVFTYPFHKYRAVHLDEAAVTPKLMRIIMHKDYLSEFSLLRPKPKKKGKVRVRDCV